MAKKRKTLEQKKQAELRHLTPQPEQTISTLPTYSLGDFTSPSFAKNNLTQSKNQPGRVSNTTASIAYTYAFSDLRKTFFTTLAIILAQIVLSFIVNK